MREDEEGDGGECKERAHGTYGPERSRRSLHRRLGRKAAVAAGRPAIVARTAQCRPSPSAARSQRGSPTWRSTRPTPSRRSPHRLRLAERPVDLPPLSQCEMAHLVLSRHPVPYSVQRPPRADRLLPYTTAQRRALARA